MVAHGSYTASLHLLLTPGNRSRVAIACRHRHQPFAAMDAHATASTRRSSVLRGLPNIIARRTLPSVRHHNATDGGRRCRRGRKRKTRKRHGTLLLRRSKQQTRFRALPLATHRCCHRLHRSPPPHTWTRAATFAYSSKRASATCP